MMSQLKRLALCFSLLIFAGAGQAAFVSIDSLTAEWINTNPLTGITNTGVGTSSTISWGRPATTLGQSSYTFDTSPTPIANNVPPATGDFLLGTWTHSNNPIYAPSLASATLKLTAGISGGSSSATSSSLGSFDFFYDFLHHETVNSANPCANGGGNGSGININGCADIVDIVFNDLSQSFMVDGSWFTLNIVESSSHFETIEKKDNAFGVYANITPVPAPATLFLFGLGLIGLGFVRRLTHN